MVTKFSAFVREIEDEAKAEGPEAVKELEALRARFRSDRSAVAPQASQPRSPR